MPLAGVMVAQKKLNFVYVVFVGVLGFLLSITPWYLAGKYLGKDGLYKYFNKQGKWIKFPVRKLKKANDWFRQYGKQTLLFAILIPGVRNLISIPAGISGIPLPLFLTYSSLGATLWLTILTYTGYVLQDRFYLVEKYFSSISNLMSAIFAIAALVWLIKLYLRLRAKV
ncbi:MAG: DedA family protein [Tolypothrix sp. T3-bin4]|nr:DedA family protein [Tolypothrix sp. T3-bin4]